METTHKPKTCQKKTLLAILGILLMLVLLQCTINAWRQNKIYQKQLQSLQETLTNCSREKNTIIKTSEKNLEVIHSIAYDQGYQSAIWDTYFQQPLYIVKDEEGANPTLWKKAEILPAHQKQIEEFNKTHAPKSEP